MSIQFNKDLVMLLKLAKFMGVEFYCPIQTTKISFSQQQLSFKISKPTQSASEYYKELSKNIDSLSELGITSSHDFLRFQTKHIWYKDIESYCAPSLFSPEYDLWFVNHLDKLFTDDANYQNWCKETFLTLMFTELKQMIIRPTSETVLTDILALQHSNPLVRDTLANKSN